MQVAWEPRLAPITLKQPAAKLKVVDEQGRSLSVEAGPAELEVSVEPSAAGVELALPLALPPREVKRIERLDGTLEVLLPGREEAFRFDKLIDAKNVEKRVAGVAVTLERVRQNNEVWEVWVGVNSTRPVGRWSRIAAGSSTTPPTSKAPTASGSTTTAFETTRRTENEIGLAYLFDLEKPPTDLTFVYKTASTILSTGVSTISFRASRCRFEIMKMSPCSRTLFPATTLEERCWDVGGPRSSTVLQFLFSYRIYK